MLALVLAHSKNIKIIEDPRSWGMMVVDFPHGKQIMQQAPPCHDIIMCHSQHDIPLNHERLDISLTISTGIDIIYIYIIKSYIYYVI